MDYSNFKKKFGQNFLKDMNSILHVVTNLEPTSGDVIAEIGPGDGAITEFIIENVKETILIEIDEELVDKLKLKFAQYLENGKLKIINRDVMEVEPESIGANKIFGSLAYNISKRIIEKFTVSTKLKFEKIVFLIQKEVGFDYVGKDGSTYLQCLIFPFYQVNAVAIVGKEKFFPIPKVDGIVLEFLPREEDYVERENIQKYKKFLRNMFISPRKKLKNSAKNNIGLEFLEKTFSKYHIEDNARIHELEPELIIQIFNDYNSTTNAN